MCALAKVSATLLVVATLAVSVAGSGAGSAATVAIKGKGDGPYQPNWQSLDARPIPEWYDDAKFGIFIHWGVYSVPAWAPVGTYAEWYWNDMMTPGGPTQAFHNATYGAGFKYQDFAPMFKAELFDPNAWADLFVRSGAQYVVPTSKHHEGFTIWPSAQSWNWNSVDVGPHRDLLGDIMTAVRARGLHAGLYFSVYEWFNPLYRGPNPPDYVTQVLIPQYYDLINNYKPDILWCDGAWEQNSTFWQTPEVIAWLYNESPVKDNVVINDRFGSDTPNTHGGFYTPEYSSTVYLNHKWEENSGIDLHSYGFNRNTPADKYWNATALVNLLVRCIANNGNLLLDIGPNHDGTIPTIMQERLLQIGAWLQVTGDAVYGSRVWRVQQEGPIDGTVLRYTVSKDQSTIYAFILQWPADNIAVIPSPITSGQTVVSLLGYGPISFSPDASGVGFNATLPTFTPGNWIPNEHVWVLSITNAK